jgi:hypothetical protein
MTTTFKLTTDQERKLERGREAMAQLSKTWEHWLDIGETLQSGREWATAESGANSNASPAWKKAFARWLAETGFDKIDKASRSFLASCLEHRDEIELWRGTLTESERMTLNHPCAVWRKWRAKTQVPKPDAEKKPGLREIAARLQEENDALTKMNGVQSKTIEELLAESRLLAPGIPTRKIATTLLNYLGEETAHEVAALLMGAPPPEEGTRKTTARKAAPAPEKMATTRRIPVEIEEASLEIVVPRVVVVDKPGADVPFVNYRPALQMALDVVRAAGDKGLTICELDHIPGPHGYSRFLDCSVTVRWMLRRLSGLGFVVITKERRGGEAVYVAKEFAPEKKVASASA